MTICTLVLFGVVCPDRIFTLSIISAGCKSYETRRKKPVMWPVLGRDALSMWKVLERQTLVFVIKTAFANSRLA